MLDEHFLWSRKLTLEEHEAAMLLDVSATNLVLDCRVEGVNPELDLSANGASGAVTGTNIVANRFGA